MEKNNMTAVEWLAKKFEECELMYGTIQSLIHKQYLDGIIKQAKQMEKEQIMKSFKSARIRYKYDADLRLNGFEDAEHYYNETFGNK